MDEKYALINSSSCDLENLTPEEAIGQIQTSIAAGIDKLRIIKNKIDESTNKAKEAEEAAKKANKIPVSFWHNTTEPLKALQSTARFQSDAQISLSESQKLLFEQQVILANCNKFLFSLCCNNILCLRIAIREITERLRGASEKEISDIARQEMLKLAQQLKQQLDILEKQERMEKRLNKLSDQVSAQSNEISILKNILQKDKKVLSYDKKEQRVSSTGKADKITSSAFSKSVSPPRRDVYILLALLLGVIGIHDFYARRYFRGIIKLAITVLSVGALCWISILWSLADIFLSIHDKSLFTTSQYDDLACTKETEETDFEGNFTNITSPLPGTIIRLEVSIGDSVYEGQTVAIIEAMKMYTEITAPSSGTVKQIFVTPSTVVVADQSIMSIG